MEREDVVERISRKFASKGITIDRKKIESKVNRLVEEFGVNTNEAERTVLNEFSREYAVPGTTGGRGADQKNIGEIASGEWITVQGKVVALTQSPSPSIAQTGILADSTGAIRFVAWARSKAPVLQQGRWYRLESAVADEYRGVPKLNIHSGTTVAEVESEMALIPGLSRIADLKPGVGSVRAKVIEEWEVNHERILQNGLLGDESGVIKFIIWKEEGKERLEAGSVYSIYYALVDEFNGRLSLNLTSAIYLTEEGDIEVKRGDTVKGVIIHIAPGSGLIKRCPVEGCNRTLSRQNYCPVHEIQQKYRYDLRIKGVLDDGKKTKNILLSRDIVESLTGITLDEAVSLAENNPLGMDEVFYRIRDAVTGRYFSCSGSEIEGRILAKKCVGLNFNPADLAALINRAGESQ